MRVNNRTYERTGSIMGIRVIKRDGTKVVYDRTKVKKSILLAADSCDVQVAGCDMLVDAITYALTRDGAEEVTLDAIGAATEDQLMAAGLGDVVRSFVIYRNARAQQRKIGGDGAGELMSSYIHQAKYARCKNGRKETYAETVDRVFDMYDKAVEGTGLEAKLDEARVLVHQKKILPSMRAMQFAGKAIEVNNARLYNCSFTLVNRMSVFGDILWLLLSGCGVGFSVQRRHTDSLPVVADTKNLPVHWHHVEDSIEGWRDAVEVLLTHRTKRVCFDYSGIRPEGAPLHTSGGRAPGHYGLAEAISAIEAILDDVAAGSGRLRPIQCHDIICHLAGAVLSGGIRRSAMISIFGAGDEEMMHCKTGRWWETAPQRAWANNSVAILRDSDGVGVLRRVLELSSGGAEPGFVFLDDLDTGINPCGEIGIRPGADSVGLCNLV